MFKSCKFLNKNIANNLDFSFIFDFFGIESINKALLLKHATRTLECDFSSKFKSECMSIKGLSILTDACWSVVVRIKTTMIRETENQIK